MHPDEFDMYAHMPYAALLSPWAINSTLNIKIIMNYVIMKYIKKR